MMNSVKNGKWNSIVFFTVEHIPSKLQENWPIKVLVGLNELSIARSTNWNSLISFYNP
jgi:hypothetical protein